MKLRKLILILWVGGIGYLGCICMTILGAMIDLRDHEGERLYPIRPRSDESLLEYITEYEKLLDLEAEKDREDRGGK